MEATGPRVALAGGRGVPSRSGCERTRTIPSSSSKAKDGRSKAPLSPLILSVAVLCGGSCPSFFITTWFEAESSVVRSGVVGAEFVCCVRSSRRVISLPSDVGNQSGLTATHRLHSHPIALSWDSFGCIFIDGRPFRRVAARFKRIARIRGLGSDGSVQRSRAKLSPCVAFWDAHLKNGDPPSDCFRSLSR